MKNFTHTSLKAPCSRPSSNTVLWCPLPLNPSYVPTSMTVYALSSAIADCLAYNLRISGGIEEQVR